MKKYYLHVFAVFSLSFMLLGCFESNMPTLMVNLKTSQFLNPNIYAQSSPVVVTFYQLKSTSVFQQSTFFAIDNNAQKALGSDLLDKYEVELKPNQMQDININLLPSTNYIGLVAAFREPDHAEWRRVVQVVPGKSFKMKVTLSASSIEIEK
jgi:type VI secretion system protein VasD